MQLLVRPLDRGNAGKGIAAMDAETMDELGVDVGDYVAIDGARGRTVVRVWPTQSLNTRRRVIGIDGQTRQEVGVNIDGQATVEPADVAPAKRVSVALPEGLRVRGELGPYLRSKLADRAVETGDSVPFSFGFGSLTRRSSRRVPVRIVETDPAGTVIIDSETTIEVATEPAQQEATEAAVATEHETPSVTYEDIGGLSDELDKVREMVELPMRHPELFQALGIDPPKGVLLHGPPGTGKTLIAQAVANEIDANFQTISGPEIMSKYYGESEERLREVFEEAEENEPAIVFIDELDSIAPKREDVSGDVERRVVAQLLSLMDGLEQRGDVTVIATTNRVDAIDPALRRGGRFDREINIGVPDTAGRKEILQIHTRGMPLADDVDIDRYAENTHGFVGADLESLTKEAAMTALRRLRPDLDLEDDEIDAAALEALTVTDADVRAALRDIEPSALREVFVEAPEVTWDDVGGLEEAKDRLKEAVQWPLEHAAAFRQVDLHATKGVLLHGPPGTGKTLLAKAVAHESQSNFISIKGPELFNKYVGESEKGVREVFSKARENAPTVIFFDELDAIATERGSGGGDSNVGERVVSQLLTELDGLEELEDVVVIAASNRPDLIDAALLRPGRIERHIEVGTPDEDARREILRIHTRDRPLADDVDIDELAATTEGFVGADLASLCREAATAAVREHVRATAAGEESPVDRIVLTKAHFDYAIGEIDPSDGRDIIGVDHLADPAAHED